MVMEICEYFCSISGKCLNDHFGIGNVKVVVCSLTVKNTIIAGCFLEKKL